MSQKCVLIFMSIFLLYIILVSSDTEVLKPVLVRNIPLKRPPTKRFDTGYEAQEYEVPSIVALDFSTRNTTWFCAGAIVGHRWILTVASCTKPASRVRISYGVIIRNLPALEMYVSNRCFFNHPDYNRNFENDIALIQTPFVKFSFLVNMMALPKMKESDPLRFPDAYSAGWGQHKITEENSQELHISLMEVITNVECIDLGYGKTLHPKMICAILPSVESSCRLDSGSPLIMQSQRTIIGLASFASHKGCRIHLPVVFTRVTEYVDWIESVIKKNDMVIS